MTLESFPRGGKKPEIKRSADVPFEEKLKPKRRKIQMKKKIDCVIVQETNLITTTADRLSKMMLCEGLVLHGRVSEVSEYELLVSLPGGFLGRVQATDLSQAYTNLLQDIIDTRAVQSNEYKPLPDLFKSGDYVTCYVKGINVKDKWFCTLSMEPQLINQNVHSNYLAKDTKVTCTVKSIEDYGYVVDTGIANVRAFISTEDVDKGNQYFPGHQLLCAIKEIKTVDNMSVIKLSTIRKKIDNAIGHDITSLDVLTPGTKLLLCITKVLSNGVQVTFGKNNVGYINRIYLDNSLSTYVENMEITGTLLYILPTVKLAYFSSLTDASEKEKLRVGDIINKAKVLYRESSGIILKLSKSGLRGYMSLRRINVPFTKVSTEFKEGSIHKCRILAYSWMDHFYICTMEEDILKEKYFSPFDLNIGDILTVTIMHIETTRGFMHVQVGKIWGYVPTEHVSDSGLSALHKLKIGDNVQARVLDIDNKNQIKFTLKQSLVKSELPVLHDFDKVECGLKYHGTIAMINRNGLLVRFYGKLKGWVPRTTLDKETYNMNWNFSIGQTVIVCVESIEKDKYKMKLRVITENEKQQAVSFLIGETIEGTVTESSVKGVYLKIQKKDNENIVTGFLPAGHMAPCIEIGSLLASRCTPGDIISAFVFATKPTMILSRTFVTPKKYRSFDSLKIGDCIPCTIRDKLQTGVTVVLPIEDYSKFGFVSYKNVSSFEQLYTNQILFVKITAINAREKQLSLTMSLKDVWESPSEYEMKMMAAVDVLSLYLSKLLELMKNTFYENRPISSVILGQKVTGIVKKITDHGLVLQLDNQLMGTVRKDHCFGDPQLGDKVFGTILWKNYVHELVDVSLLPKIINGISSKQKTLPELPTGVALRAEILMITKWLILVLVKRNGTGYLAALPVRRHVNDSSPDLTPYKVHAKIRLYVITRRDETIVPICMLKSAFETPKDKIVQKLLPTKNKQSKDKIVKELSPTKNKQLKRNKSEPHNVDLVDLSTKKAKEVSKKVLNERANEKNKNKVKEKNRIKDIDENSELDEDTVDESETEANESVARLRIPECGFSWDKEKLPVSANAVTSSDDEEPEEESKGKKKKLSAAERREQERQKEREIRQREEALASNQAPNSVDQFDRLVLSSPDSSLVWLQYIAYHLQATEIDKARAVARRAIKTINFREENERLNIWNAWLNLESRYGTIESLNDVFQEAVRTNDAYKVYMHMLTVQADAGRKIELEKLINTVIGKFKQDSQTWIDCGAALLKIGMKEKSRQIMQRALQSLPASQLLIQKQ
ncbi:protein RRP5 homolog isoform X2 [Monomorium pharaonis]|uniref:protein RRP5 homolog isoform X2 n=1 Tax=Monomorium pharaonis TaxID=307658 RepID=UPI001745C933|nr:protein RRP5 homolog isoform X2 [Monomorium pharaonis]